MTIQEIARIEGVTERSAQRYVTVGYKGIKLPAVKLGRTYSIAIEDYRAWRVQCGWDFLPQQDVVPDVRKVTQVEVIAPEPVAPRRFPRYPQPADPDGVLTNVPHEHSRNMPHPLACQEYMEERAQQLKAKLRGYDDTEN